MSVIDVCNAALRKNHHMALIPPTADLDNPVGKAQEVCAEFHAQARRAILRLSSWPSVTKRIYLQKDRWAAATAYAEDDRVVESSAVYKCTTAGTSGVVAPVWPASGAVADNTTEWTFEYNVKAQPPDENLTQYSYAYAVPEDIVRMIEVQDIEGTPVDFESERHIIYANSDEPILRYIPDEEDDELWDPLLKEAIVTQLASMISYPLTGSHENEVAYAQAAANLVNAASKKARREARQGPPDGNQWADELFGERFA